MPRRPGALSPGIVLLAVIGAALPNLVAAADQRRAHENCAMAERGFRLNRTERTLSLLVDLRADGRQLGEVSVKITPDDVLSVHKEQLMRASAALLRPDVRKRMRQLKDDGGFVTLANLNAAGFRYSFDAGAMKLCFKPEIAQRPRGVVSLDPRSAAGHFSPSRPATVSGYVNIRAAADHVTTTFAAPTGFQAPRADLEAALRWQDVVLEAEATYDGAHTDFFGAATLANHTTHGFVRRSTRLVHDRPEDALRLQAGDIYPPVTSLQRGLDLLGVSIERTPRKLRPSQNIRPTGKRSFRLARPSTVKIELNGIVMRQLRLDPGEYDLDDLPLRGGANRIRLIISDDVGEQRTLNFTSHFDATLLAEDIAEWGLAAGVPAQFSGDGLSYIFERPLVSGFYRRGLSAELTGEAHIQAGPHAMMTGLSLYSASMIGFLAIETAASYHEHHGAGAALEIDWDVLRVGDSNESLQLSAELRSAHFTVPALDDHLPTYWLNLSASYARSLPWDIYGQLSARYSAATESADGTPANGDLYGATLSFSRRLSSTAGLAFSLSYASDSLDTLTAFDPDGAGEGELRAALQLTWRPDANTHLAATLEAGEPGASIAASRTWRDGISSWRTSIETVYEENTDDLTIDGDLHYTGNRFTAGVTHTASLDARAFARGRQPLSDQRTTFHFGTAIAFADGHMAIGPPILGPGGFAIVAPHDSLTDKPIVIGSHSRPRARSDMFGPALVSGLPAYRPSRLAYDVAELPLGYDIGSREFRLNAPYKGGYALTVGSANSVTAFGTLIGTDGEPVALVTGTARPVESDTPLVNLFTNAAGRFGAQGLAPGRWRIEMATDPPQHFLLDVPAATVGLLRAGTLRPVDPAQE